MVCIFDMAYAVGFTGVAVRLCEERKLLHMVIAENLTFHEIYLEKDAE